MNKTIFQKISIVAVIAIIITPLFSCHPDGPEDFIDYVYDAGNMGGGNQNTNTNDWSYPTSKPQQLWSGSGYSYDPYIIKTAQDLANLAYMVNNSNSYEYTYFKLDRSIDLNYGISVNAYSSNAKEWTSIGNTYNQFKGNFDGNSYTIDGLYKNSLFGDIYNGSVKNLTMGTGYIYNSNYTGSIASYIYNTTISNCKNNGTTVTSSYYDSSVHIGGLIGEMKYSSISNSSNNATVSSSSGYAGGIAGYMTDSSNISNSYNYANISSSSGCAGGIAGYMIDSSNISNSYNYANISSSSGYAGGIAGYASDNNSYCSGCYNNGTVYGSTTGEIIGNERDWSYPTEYPNHLWSGSGYSYDPYIIKTAQDLAKLAYMVNDYGYSYYDTYFRLDNDIDLNNGISVNESSSNAKEWTSIGSSSYPFKGNFDGNNYTINGLYKNSLFGYIYNGSVTNLTMGTGYIYSYSDNVGSIADYIYNTTIYNCTNKETAISSSSYGGYVGGLVGKMESSEISFSYNYSDISSTYGTAGGIVGYADYNSSCSGCYNYGYVSGSTTDEIIGNR